MILDLPKASVWKCHLEQRFIDAQGKFVPQNTILRIESAQLFVPDSLLSYADILPNQSLRMLNQNIFSKTGWTIREDLYSEAAAWIKRRFSGEPDSVLLCEAGYSRLGDKVLGGRPHIAISGNAYLYSWLTQTEVNEIAQVIRWGRSYRFIGVVGRSAKNRGIESVPSNCSLFMCDALDGDSMIVAPIHSQDQREP